MPVLGGFWTRHNRRSQVEKVAVGDYKLNGVMHNEVTLPVPWQSAAAYFVTANNKSDCEIIVTTDVGSLTNDQDDKARISTDCSSLSSEDAMTLVGQFNDLLTQPKLQ
jgi:hypothetical protein